ncbi:pyridoxal-phosphate-dependent aminotransferase family protein, partial [Leucobacter sp. M11]|uniref:pyridoxal-phosphate-dependent aminotransferase family protein n=1 Tax=Leucobacter sp. M11 TaxID=2993565 RepID=UPI002D7FF30E
MSRFMLQPGPTQIDPRVLQATMRPVIHHSDPEFTAELDRTCDLLRPIFGVPERGEVVIVPVSGRGGLEAAATTLTDGERPVLVLHTGVFSGMFLDVMASLNIPTVSLSALPGERLSLDEIEAALVRHRPMMLSVAQVETSTGVEVSGERISELAELAHRHDCLMMVDAVAALGAVPLDMKAQDLDVVVAGSQKTLGGMTGLAMLGFSERAIDVMRRRPEGIARSYFLDLARWWRTWLPAERGGEQALGARRMNWSMNTHGVFALQRACELAHEEGLPARIDRHERVSRAFQAAAEHLGFGFLDEPEHRSRTVTVLTPPPGITAAEILRVLSEEHQLAAAGGLGAAWAGRVIRFGHMAETARERVAETALSGLVDALRRHGVPHPADAHAVFWDAI